MKHVHAKLMMQYALTAMGTDSPYLMWQHNAGGGWVDLKAHPTWDSGFEYRRKPNNKTVMIDGEEFIIPKSFEPEFGHYYYSFYKSKEGGCAISENKNYKDTSDIYLIESGNCYKTEQEAEQALAFWRKVNEV